MNYKNQKILLVASENAYKEGSLTQEQFLKIILDIEDDLIKADRVLLEQEINDILNKYANI